MWFTPPTISICVRKADSPGSVRPIKEYGLTGVVVCSCSPRMHEATFRKTAQSAGLNPYMVEIANIREHCSWIHKDKMDATAKAIVLARTAVAKLNLNQPLTAGESNVVKRALVIGGRHRRHPVCTGHRRGWLRSGYR